MSKEPSRVRRFLGWVLAFFIPVFFVCGWLLCIVIFYLLGWSPNWMGGLIGVILVAASVLFAISQRLRVRGAATRLAVDPRPPVLFLRSFQDDQTGLFSTDTYEQHLETALKEIGPVVAIGQPRDTLPPLGAERLYLQNDEWQQSVIELMGRSRIVVILAGATPGLLFEIRTAVKCLDPKQLLISLPERLKPTGLPLGLKWKGKVAPLTPQERYSQFRSAVGDELPSPLPESIGRATFLCFDQDWVPQLLSPTRWRPYNLDQPSKIRETIRPFCERLGIRLRKTRTLWFGFVFSFLLVISAAVTVLVTVVQFIEWFGSP